MRPADIKPSIGSKAEEPVIEEQRVESTKKSKAERIPHCVDVVTNRYARECQV